MENISKASSPLKRRDVAYYRQRQKNRVFTALAAFFASEAARGNITKKELANRLGKDPSQITRWLSAPSNFELDTLSDILLAMGAEMDHEIVCFSDRHKQNYVHPAISSAETTTADSASISTSHSGNKGPFAFKKTSATNSSSITATYSQTCLEKK
jgi:transcriptional regulator with XRE-family HTH domain